jgi:hypothetical protein
MKLARKSRYVRAIVMSGVLAAFVPSVVEATRRSGHHSPDSRSSPHSRNSGRCSMLVTRAILLITTLLACQPAFAQSRAQIELGRKLFLEETFDGNGRTCGTCHPATNNFTLDPAFVRALPRNDPLFVIRSTPELADLEIRRFLRQGTILENVDTFDNPGVMRGVPHTLALRTSTQNGATG